MLIRRASSFDAASLAELLNEIRADDGARAKSEPDHRKELQHWIVSNQARSLVLVAEDARGVLFGFQSVEPSHEHPDMACEIATFVKHGRHQICVGSALFKKTVSAARQFGYRWINASILTENDGGLTYYQSRGFETWKHDSTRVHLRFNLD